MLALATTAIAMVAPWLAKVAEGVARKAGEKTFEKLGQLYDAVKQKFYGDGDSKILENLERAASDQTAKEAATKALTSKLENDPAFAGEVQRLVNDAKSDPATSNFLTQVYGGDVGKIVNIGTARDVSF